MFEETFPEYTLYQLGQQSEALQRQGYECSPQIDFIPLLPQNPVSSKMLINLASYLGINYQRGEFFDTEGSSKAKDATVVKETKSEGQNLQFKLW